MLTVHVSEGFLEKALTSQMEPVRTNVANIEAEVRQKLQNVQERVTRDVGERVNQMSTEVQRFKGDIRTDIQNIEQALVKRVDNVVSRVSPLNVLTDQITQSEKRLLENINSAMGGCKGELVKISSSLERPNVKGLVGEKQVINVLEDRFRNFTVADVSTQREIGSDILVESPRQHKIMIEVKNRASSNVPKNEIDRFKNALARNSNVKVGILFSMKSGIANKASNGKFEVEFHESRYQIYVPNAGTDEALIVWSVLLADELAEALRHGELGASQVQKLLQLYSEFKVNVEMEKTCSENLDSIEKSAKSLRKSLDFIIGAVNETGKKLKTLLDSGATTM